jgi:glycosyltransferase involved in cell wall biosynthesis
MKNPASWIKYNYGFDKMIAISQGVRNVLIGCGVKKGKITTIHSGIDMKHFTTAVEASYLYKEFNLNKTHPRVGIIAALAPHKDHENFLQAATIVKETLPTTKFLIVGEGKLKGRITKRISELNLEDSVILTGFRKDVKEILSILDCFVLSSYEEGLGLSLLEAQAVGVPVVATRTGGIPEIIEDGVSGLLVPPRNPQALAKGIITLLSDKKLAARISERAKRDVEKFDFQRTIDETEKLYRELLDEDTLRFSHNSSK